VLIASKADCKQLQVLRDAVAEFQNAGGMVRIYLVIEDFSYFAYFIGLVSLFVMFVSNELL
jgi:hypothetical protein